MRERRRCNRSIKKLVKAFQVRRFCLTPKALRIAASLPQSCSQKNPQFFDAILCDSMDYRYVALRHLIAFLQLSFYSFE